MWLSADDPNLLCPTCKKNLTNELTYVSPKSPFNIEGGFVKESVSYIVMDNLEFSSISSKHIVTLFNNLRVEKEVTELQEMVVDLGEEEVHQLSFYLHKLI